MDLSAYGGSRRSPVSHPSGYQCRACRPLKNTHRHLHQHHSCYHGRSQRCLAPHCIPPVTATENAVCDAGSPEDYPREATEPTRHLELHCILSGERGVHSGHEPTKRCTYLEHEVLRLVSEHLQLLPLPEHLINVVCHDALHLIHLSVWG